MTELSINVSAENLVLGGFLCGLVLSWIGAGVRALLGLFDDSKTDPEF